MADVLQEMASNLYNGEEEKVAELVQQALDQGMARIETYMRKAVARGKMDAAKVERMRGNIKATLELKDLASCDYVLEAATEDLKTKQAILSKLEEVVSDDCLIGFATSGIPRARIVEGIKRPARCFVNHPFFPAWRSPPVEVVLSGDDAFGERITDSVHHRPGGSELRGVGRPSGRVSTRDAG